MYKRDHYGHILLHYHGQVLERGPGWVCIQAAYSFAERDLDYITLRRGDLFTEWFYADRWYNVFRVQDQNGPVRGWYCNITRPAYISGESVASDDLALDLFVYPDGRTLLLDEDEFAALPLNDQDRRQALAAVETLRGLVARRLEQFAEIVPA